MLYIFWFLIGFGLTVTGGVSIISYMNLLPAGVSWFEFFHFIMLRLECYFFPIGIVIMLLVLYRYPNNS